MAVVKIHEIVLYTCDTINPVDGHEVAAWLDHTDIQYIRLHYNNEGAIDEVIKNLNTWWPDKKLTENSWPFVVYKEQHDDGRPSYVLTSNFIEGADSIKEQLPPLCTAL
jgi:hypothetical protein